MLINVNFLRGRLYLSTVSKAYKTYVMGDWVKSHVRFSEQKNVDIKLFLKDKKRLMRGIHI